MDFIPNAETFSLWLINYGSFALFGLLALGIIALPIPEETLMVLAGILMYNGQVSIPATIIAALGGSILGITVSYILGSTLGLFFLHKYGKYVGLTEKRLNIVHDWFEHFGKWTLIIGYFIPGVRHLTGFAAGSSQLEYKYFALFGYTGALLWVSVFLSIGYFFGDYWLAILANFRMPVDEIVTTLIFGGILACGVYIFYKINKRSDTTGK